MFLDINWKNFSLLDVLKGCSQAYLVDLDSKPRVVQDVVKYRLSVCESCPLNENGWCNTKKEIQNIETGQMVKGCGCNLKCKTALLSQSCPASKWKAVKL